MREPTSSGNENQKSDKVVKEDGWCEEMVGKMGRKLEEEEDNQNKKKSSDETVGKEGGEQEGERKKNEKKTDKKSKKGSGYVTMEKKN